MAKRLKYFSEVQIMHNNMESIKTTNGSLDVVPKEITVGKNGTFLLTYTVGEESIEIGGVLRFTIPFGFTKPQIDMPVFPGYTTAMTTRKNAKTKTFIVENDWWKRGPDHTKVENVSEHVGNHVWVRILGHALTKGDQVFLTLAILPTLHRPPLDTAAPSDPFSSTPPLTAKGFWKLRIADIT